MNRINSFRILTLLFVFGSISQVAVAQDPEFTQFYANPIYTNPAFAGTADCDGGGRVNLNYRNQWPSLPGTFVTTAASYDQHFDGIGGGVGVRLLRDQAGEGLLTSQSAALQYSYFLPVNRKFALRFGIEAEYGQRSIDWARLRFEDQIDPTTGFVGATRETYNSDVVNYANFAAGLLGFTENFYFGFATHNLIQPNQSFFGNEAAIIPRRYTAHAGMVIPLDGRKNPESSISPNMLFMIQNQFTQMNLGFYYNKGPLVTGLWFRQTFGEFNNADALMVLLGFRKDRFKAGVSYDLTVSSARTAAPGSWELSVSMDWCARKRPLRFKPIRCPDF